MTTIQTEPTSATKTAREAPLQVEKPLLRRYHAARWDEPLIFQLDAEGHRGIAVPSSDESQLADTPENSFRRKDVPSLPQIGQSQVLRHYLRLSQETLGADLNVDIGQGTCTMKYSPKVNERFAGSGQSVDTHPLQDASTMQGTLQILHELESYLGEVSGMDAVSLQAGSGSAAIYGNVKVVQAYHEARGEGDVRDEIITTIFSHPSNAATAKTAGYKVITLYPDENGFPDLEALKSVTSERTAALFITNPEDTGIFNPRITEYVDAVHEVGGLCVYDQANANGLLGIARAREAGFDLCHFNLHKTFSTPHACGGPAAGAIGSSAQLAPFLPGRRVVKGANGYVWQVPDELATADIRPFHGVIPNLIRAYSWIRSLGAEGLRQVSEIAVLNNNYLLAEILKIDGISAPYAAGQHRVEQVRYSWSELTDETGIGSAQIGARMADYGMHYWTSHHPYIVPEPVTLEPTESYSKRELDEYIAALRNTAMEARVEPEVLQDAPHRSSIHTVDVDAMTDPDTWATSWRAYRRKYQGAEFALAPRWEPDGELPVRPRPPKAHHR
ncbi:aminomethyl-transferring glycine dehydrogenase subunit GcvPB [Paeniglutamicibacter sp. ABSL32-1]|uniref:aminomethyl-transferring glycine dehydrogenase subunit GcvPB n=1 Tax=Paeniglutamicibacter quisquiliarum TaxID=2849498 RepID=UPI001C2DB10F|nr:aminomethyl-transferring glycine dehydrogenase subunit GcvPB [Paeniglutamicibacter quisquiliarum]MBV1777698.1 aminomethyl-transferring glycine dehydrogenase subunit GcvPB [Paeniglutamicibacter quisquiliarum]